MIKIRLEKYNPTDFNEYFKLVQDDELMKYISGKGLGEEQANHKFTSILEKIGNVMPNPESQKLTISSFVPGA